MQLLRLQAHAYEESRTIQLMQFIFAIYLLFIFDINIYGKRYSLVSIKSTRLIEQYENKLAWNGKTTDVLGMCSIIRNYVISVKTVIACDNQYYVTLSLMQSCFSVCQIACSTVMRNKKSLFVVFPIVMEGKYYYSCLSLSMCQLPWPVLQSDFQQQPTNLRHMTYSGITELADLSGNVLSYKELVLSLFCQILGL